MNFLSKTHEKQCSSVCFPSGNVPFQQWPTRNSSGRKAEGDGAWAPRRVAKIVATPRRRRWVVCMRRNYATRAQTIEDLLPRVLDHGGVVGRPAPKKLGGADACDTTEVAHE